MIPYDQLAQFAYIKVCQREVGAGGCSPTGIPQDAPQRQGPTGQGFLGTVMKLCAFGDYES